MVSFIIRRRGRLTVATAVAIAVVAVLFAWRSTQARATSGGDAYTVPLAD